jgi:integrase
VGGGLKPTTLGGYRQAVSRLKRMIGDVKLQELRPLTVERAYQQLLSSGLAAKTVRNTHTVLRRALADAERLDLVVRNAAAAARPPSVRRKEQETWTPEELSRFLASVADHRLFAAFVLSATTGMRRGELMGLRWRDVDLDAGRLSIVSTITTVNGRAVESSTKTNKSRRRISLDAGTIEVLRAHQDRQSAEREHAGKSWTASGLVFTREDGTALHPDRFSHLFVRLSRKAGLPPIRLHDLRHTYATLALEAGVHPKIVSERLGHATTGITLDLYSHVAPSMDQQAAETIAGLFSLPNQSSDRDAASA